MSAQPPFDKPDSDSVTEENAGKSSSGLKKSVMIALIVLLTGASAGGTWYFMKDHAPGSTEEKTDENAETSEDEAEKDDTSEETAENEEEESSEDSEPPIFVALDPFTVNLQPDGQFLQATFSLQMKTEKDAAQLQVFMPQIRSRLLLMLSGKTAESLSSQQGKADLIKEIKQLVSKPFKTGQKPLPVEDVHVTAFIIQ